MPIRLLVRARHSQTFPAPGSWAKGDIVIARPEGHVWGRLEGLPEFVRCDLTFQNTPDSEWVNEQLNSGGGRRSIGLTEAEVDSVVTADGTRSYGSAGQFVSRLERKTRTAALMARSAVEVAPSRLVFSAPKQFRVREMLIAYDGRKLYPRNGLTGRVRIHTASTAQLELQVREWAAAGKAVFVT